MTQPVQWHPSHFYVTELQSVVDSLSTDVHGGMSAKSAAARLSEEGHNAIERESDVKPWRILFEQFKSSVVILLLVAAGISVALHEYLQTSGIIVAVVINAMVGFLTEFRAKVSLEKLSQLVGATARICRNGEELLVPVGDLVRGDVLLLQPGDKVPADCRLVEAPALSVDESLLTGESVPVWKDRGGKGSWENAVLFQGTSIAKGRAKAVVISVGSDTRLGRLAIATRRIDDSATPLQISLDELGRKLTWITCTTCVVVAMIGIFVKGIPPLRMIETSIALAVAAVPEALPVVATLALAFGIRRMVARKALVRRLTAVETLGCTTAICTDKTGTLTQNKMSVKSAFTAGGAHELTTGNEDLSVELARLLTAAALCNDAVIEHKGEKHEVIGDPTEAALLLAAHDLELDEHATGTKLPRITELPFDLDRKRMSTVHAMGERGTMVFCKGSPELLIPLCSTVATGNNAEPMDEDTRNRMLRTNQELASRGLRVLAVAERAIPDGTVCIDATNLETNLTLLGLVAMSDTLRPEIAQSIESCKKAGIQVIMLTGDQIHTAQAVAKSIGIDQVMARVTPEMKLAAVQDLRAQGHVVAMTGDGVNDAPALKQSNIGVAMGQSGSDLARDASDVVITDDNFATIVAAIEEGRAIYRNIKRAVAYLLTASMCSVLVVAIGVFANSQLLLNPLQLLWLNLIMHVFPGIGLVMQRDTSDAMLMPPRDPKQPLLTTETLRSIALRSVLISLAVAFAPSIVHPGEAGTTDSSICFVVVSLSLLMQSWAWLWDRSVRSQTMRFDGATLTNAPMLAMTFVGLSCVVAALYLPPLASVLQTQPLDATEWMVSLVVTGATFALSLLLCSGRQPTTHRLLQQVASA